MLQGELRTYIAGKKGFLMSREKHPTSRAHTHNNNSNGLLHIINIVQGVTEKSHAGTPL